MAVGSNITKKCNFGIFRANHGRRVNFHEKT
jgi:hypothetical protein